MGRIIICHIYEEETDRRKKKEFDNRNRRLNDKNFDERLNDLLGSNEQKYVHGLGYI